MKKVLVTGSRNWDDKDKMKAIFRWLTEAPDSDPEILLIQGGVRGADSQARLIALELGWPVATFPALWRREGRYAAGPKRNRRMFDAAKPDVVWAFPLPGGSGTKDMMTYAESKGCVVINCTGS